MALVLKNPLWNAGDVRNVGLIHASGRFPGRWNSNPFLRGEFQGQRSLAGYSPWGHKESHSWSNLIGLQQRRQWPPTPVLLPGKSHGWRSLVGCSPWGPEKSDTTERLHFHFSPSGIGEGNGNPLQCSFLENPRNRGAWWATVSGVAQSRTRLKRFSSSSSSSTYAHKLVFI